MAQGLYNGVQACTVSNEQEVMPKARSSDMLITWPSLYP